MHWQLLTHATLEPKVWMVWISTRRAFLHELALFKLCWVAVSNHLRQAVVQHISQGDTAPAAPATGTPLVLHFGACAQSRQSYQYLRRYTRRGLLYCLLYCWCFYQPARCRVLHSDPAGLHTAVLRRVLTLGMQHHTCLAYSYRATATMH